MSLAPVDQITMTYESQLLYYSELLALQYRNKARAVATMQALADEVMAGNLLRQIQAAYNLDPSLGPVAQGVQLDVLGKYAGVGRDVLTFTGGAVLDDTDFLTLIRLATVKNNSDLSLKDIDDMLQLFLGGTLVAFDNLNMTMGYFFNSTLGTVQLARAFVALGMLPRATGVQISSLVYGGGVNNSFGYVRYATPSFTGPGFNRYGAGVTAAGPWLRYTNTVSI